jgi:hypothetical protein
MREKLRKKKRKQKRGVKKINRGDSEGILSRKTSCGNFTMVELIGNNQYGVNCRVLRFNEKVICYQELRMGQDGQSLGLGLVETESTHKVREIDNIWTKIELCLGSVLVENTKMKTGKRSKK